MTLFALNRAILPRTSNERWRDLVPSLGFRSGPPGARLPILAFLTWNLASGTSRCSQTFPGGAVDHGLIAAPPPPATPRARPPIAALHYGIPACPASPHIFGGVSQMERELTDLVPARHRHRRPSRASPSCVRSLALRVLDFGPARRHHEVPEFREPATGHLQPHPDSSDGAGRPAILWHPDGAATMRAARTGSVFARAHRSQI